MFCSSYDLLSKKQAELERKNYQLIIMDESHCIKNDKSARTRAAEPLMKVSIHILEGKHYRWFFLHK
jgi:SWI/SNF-related matrix-associated actin-dependent regulator 1 of chromatin subfamily A